MARTRVSRCPLWFALGLLLAPSLGAAQTRPFLFSVTPGHEPGAPRAIVFADLAYGRDLFEALGPEALESRVGAQLTLGSRATLLSHVGWTTGDGTGDANSRVTAEAEALIDALPARSRAVLAFGAGARRDYDGSAVALGRVVAGYRWQHTTAVTNLRLERAFETESAEAPRDPMDVISTFGVAREVGNALHLGVESVAEDLEGLVESDEAEGGAKLMVGPHLRVEPPGAPWHFLLAGGPVFRLTQSTAASPSPAVRDLSTRTGYVVRTSIDYRW